ncbi:unnamed protein product, partial [Coregonus sp. 'balchen']
MGLNFHHPGADHIMPLNNCKQPTWYALSVSYHVEEVTGLGPHRLEAPLSLLSPRQWKSNAENIGRSSLFPFEDGFLDDGHGDPSLTPGLNSPTRCQNGERMERYSRKVFVGDEITNSFRRYGHLVVDWPHKAESKSYFPPK